MALLKKYTARGIDDVFSTIVNFLTSDPGTPGKDWTIHADHRVLSNPYTYKRVILRNTGKSNNEEIFAGIYGVTNSDGFNSGLILKTYYAYDNSVINGQFATHFFNGTYGNKSGDYYNTRNFIPMRDDASSSITKPPVDVWVYSNKSRILIIINSDEKYACGYTGQYVRFVTPQEVPYPLMCWTDSFNGGNGGEQSEGLWGTWLGYTTVEWDGGYEANRNRRNTLFAQHGGWSFANTGQRHFSCNRIMTPTGWGYDWRMDPTGYNASSDLITGTPVNYPDGGTEILLYPLTVYHYTPSQADYMILGQLDGVYWAPNVANTIQAEVGSPDCILFPDINRTEWYSWMAVKDVL